MKPIFRIAGYVFIILALATVALFWAIAMIDSLFAFRSPLKDQAPVTDEAQRTTEPLTRRVVLVLVDALRYDTAADAKVMPTLNRLRAQGASAKMHSQAPSYSEAGYSTLLTGGWPYLNDGPAMNLDYEDIPTWTQDNLFTAAARAGKGTAVSGYYWFEKLIPQSAVNASFYTPGEDAAADRQVLDAALPWLEDAQSYALVLVHIDQVDFAGHHEGGPRDPRWNEAAARADGMIEEIAARLDFEQDTLLVFSDHGQVDRGGHGGHEPVVLVEPLVMVGSGVRPGVYPDMQMVDLAPTVAVLFGINLPASSQGQAQLDMLTLPEVTIAQQAQAALGQQEGLVRAYTAAIGQPYTMAGEASPAAWQIALQAARAGRQQAERLPRGIAAFVLVGAASFLILRAAGKNLVWFIAAAAVYFAVYNLRYLVLDGLTYTFSAVAGATELVLYNAVTASAAFLAAAVVFRYTPRREKRPGAAEGASETLRLGLFIAWLLALAAMWNFVVNGVVVTWTTPEPVSFFFGLAALLQLFFVGLASLLAAAIAALMGRNWATRRHWRLSGQKLP